MATVINKDIFYGLPTFPSIRGKRFTAVVTGANGITGHHLVRAFNESPERWEAIYGLSRRPPQNALKSDIVKYLSVDFLQSPEEIAKKLTQIHHMYVAFHKIGIVAAKLYLATMSFSPHTYSLLP